MAKRVIIIGAGLAGIAASAALTDRGFHTILIERRRLLGGRATSFYDSSTESLLDNCQHVLLGCCTNLLRLYERLGIRDKIEFFDIIHFADETGRRSELYATAVPSPLHLAVSLLRFKLLNLTEKHEIAQAMLAIKFLGRNGREAAKGITFEIWLRDHGQSPCTIQRFWNIILTSALNEDVCRLDAGYGIQVFQEAFLSHRAGYRMGLPVVPLSELYANAIAGELRLGTRVTEILEDGSRIIGVMLASGECILGDYVVLATAPEAARRLLEKMMSWEKEGRRPFRPAATRVWEQLGALEHSPILGAHLWYDRSVMELPHLALVGTRLQWIFRKDDQGRHLHGVVSAAYAMVGLDQETLTKLFDEEIRRLLPAAQGATLKRSLIVKEKRATFSPRPGVDNLRPTQVTQIPGLLLAGDYTRTGWPATMEGAVRSGYLAAEAVPRR